MFAERLVLLVLLSLIPLRAVIAETPGFEVSRLFRNLDTPVGALPATTLAINAIILAAFGAAAWLGARRGGPGYRWTGAEFGAAVLLLGMVISTTRAGQKHLAFIGSLDFFGLLLYMAALRQVLTSAWHVRLMLAVVLATGAVVIAKCGYQYWIETPDAIRYFEEHREEFVGPPGRDLSPQDAGLLYDYEQRLRSGSVSGYFNHPNVLASYLIMVVISAMGVCRQRWGNRAGWTLAAPGIIAAAGAVALYLSDSKGAMITCAAAVALWLFIEAMGRAGPARRRWAVIIVLLAAAVIALLVGTTLWNNPRAAGLSMLYRTFYWRGAWEMFRHEGAWGIGADNFGRLFTRYKAVECPEDVDDPHSWVVKAAVEWGWLGLVGLAAVFIGVARRIVRVGGSVETARCNQLVQPVETTSAGGSIILWTGGIGAVVFGWWAALLAGTSGGYRVLVLHLPAVVWVLAFALCAMETGLSRAFTADRLRPIGGALWAAMTGFALHTGIDLAMFEGGAATTFFALMAAVLATAAGERSESGEIGLAYVVAPTLKVGKRQRSGGIVIGIGGLGASIMIVMFAVRPTARLGALLAEGRVDSAARTWTEYEGSKGCRSYRLAIEAYALDGTAIDELLDELSRRVSTVGQAESAMGLVAQLQARDRRSSLAFKHLATLRYQRFVLAGDVSDLHGAIEAMEETVAAYPASPTRRLMLGELYEKLAGVTGSPADRRRAAAELRKGLELDKQRVYVSAPHHLGEQSSRGIMERILNLER